LNKTKAIGVTELGTFRPTAQTENGNEQLQPAFLKMSAADVSYGLRAREESITSSQYQ